jgi:predicted hydrocarbon binding protein
VFDEAWKMENYLSLIAVAADAMLIVDEDGVVRLANPAAEGLLGRTANAIVGETFGFPMVTHEATDLDVWRRDGTTAIAEMRVVETEWEGRRAYLASLRDITERKRATEALRQAHDELEMRIAERTAELVTANEQLQQEVSERKRAEQELLRTAVSRKLVGQMLRDLRIVGNLSQGSMFRAGEELAHRVAATHHAPSTSSEPTLTLTEFLEAYVIMGLGTLTLIDASEAQQRWRFHGDALVEVEAGQDQPTCAYTQGFLCGAVSFMLGGLRVASVETACQSMGDPTCCIVVQVVEG